MQLPAAQTSLEPLPHRVNPVRPRAVREPEHHQDDGSRFASEPDQVQRLRMLLPDSRRRVKQVADYGPLPVVGSALAAWIMCVAWTRVVLARLALAIAYECPKVRRFVVLGYRPRWPARTSERNREVP
jgi:hypothetical protein